MELLMAISGMRGGATPHGLQLQRATLHPLG
eukprot:CAMPEP_0196175926 /NCGR_PEP_ID=MMETSP0911-20130528/8371_1 /TAXON_ID=49265 /ORGANISM="Thalassiosira rotula, Strain GSO102" /LENGTH=30 /DNA_ID= /DNA_START= /DNA_END= /DNA_ORIENTATION=